ncbi:MAG: hypothetical protein K6B70_00445 [Clostridia bacterium]|nr:hypothetical protein [Clostridia bacterium]
MKSKTQRIEIDLSQSSGLDEQMLVNATNLCYKINSNTQLRFLFQNMDFPYEISLPEDIFISNYDELIRNKNIRRVSIYNSNLFLNQDLLDRCGGMIRDIKINDLSYSVSEYMKVKEVAEKIITRIASKNEFEKFMIIYNYLVNSIEYEKNSLNKDSLKGALCDKKCVCAGYVEALSLLLTKAGIECNEVYGNTRLADDKCFPEHVWSQVKINGKWYNCDVTWDSMQRDKRDDYEFCLLSDSDFKRHYPLKKNQIYYNCEETFERRIIKIFLKKENNNYER